MKKTILSLAAVAMLCSCTEELQGETENTGSQELTFTTAINLPTKATDTDFVENDTISVSAFDELGELVKDAASYTHNGTLFASTDPTDPIIYSTDSETYTFYAAYPAQSSLQTSLDFYAQTDQSVDGAFEASDLLFATITSSDRTPELSFYHKMSSIVVNITGETGGSPTFNAKVGMKYTFANDSTSALGDTTEVTPADNGTDSFKVILAPQSVALGTKLATCIVDNLTYELTYEWITDEAITLSPGYQYVYTWNLVDHSVTLDTVIKGWEVTDSGLIESK